MLVRLLSTAVLLAGCAAPVIQPSISHSADYCPDARTTQSGKHELSHNELDDRTPDYAGGFLVPRDSTWTDLLPDNRTGCIVGLVVVVVLIIATATVWR